MDYSGLVVSRKNHPVTLAYDGKALIIPPRGRCKIKDKRKLGLLPHGVRVI